MTGISFCVMRIVTFALGLYSCACAAQDPAGTYSYTIRKPDPYRKWSHQTALGAGMEVKWDGNDPNNLIMEMSAPTRGWLGIGFSRTGGMADSDIVWGWVDNRGVPHLVDAYAHGHGPPIQDPLKDYELTSADEQQNRTTIGFSRRWDTCDDKDFQIGNGTVKLIWAYHSEDPILGKDLRQFHHGSNRGVRSVYMRTRCSPMTRFSEDQLSGRNAQVWDVAMRTVRVSRRLTSHICKIVKFPRSEKKNHLIGFTPAISPGNEGRVRRISLYLCELPPQLGNPINLFESYLQMPEQECYSHFTPMDWQEFCTTFTFSLGMGSEGEALPSHVGIPLGQSSYGNYFKLEVQYDNPSLRTFTDSSGLKIYYTDNLRRFDAATLFLGHRITPFQMIPQAQQDFKTYSFCSKECTQRGISAPDGLKIISVLFNGHLTATRVLLRHIRNGKELPPIAEDSRYDSQYQQFRVLPSEVNVLPGDELIVECNYNTSGRRRMTFGGFLPEDEICQAVVLYYPKTNLTDCRSQPELYSFINAFGVSNVSGELLTKFHLPFDGQPMPQTPARNLFPEPELLPLDNSFQLMRTNHDSDDFENPFDFLQITSPFHRDGMSVGEYLRKMNWNDGNLARRLENSWKNGNHYMFCGRNNQRRIQTANRVMRFPTFEKYEDFRRPECRYENQKRKSEGSLVRRPSHVADFNLLLFVATCSLVIKLLMFNLNVQT